MTPEQAAAEVAKHGWTVEDVIGLNNRLCEEWADDEDGDDPYDDPYQAHYVACHMIGGEYASQPDPDLEEAIHLIIGY